jgi:hypothetical protein
VTKHIPEPSAGSITAPTPRFTDPGNEARGAAAAAVADVAPLLEYGRITGDLAWITDAGTVRWSRDDQRTKGAERRRRLGTVVVIGKLDQFDDGFGVNPEKLETFELFRTSLTDTEIMTYDELYQRARFIVEN